MDITVWDRLISIAIYVFSLIFYNKLNRYFSEIEAQQKLEKPQEETENSNLKNNPYLKRYEEHKKVYKSYYIGLYLVGFLMTVYIGNPMIAIVLASCLTASEDDIKSLYVYDYYSYLPGIIILIAIISKFCTYGSYPFGDIIFALIPILFCILTVFTRGLADTFMMLTFGLYGFYINNPFVIILGYMIAYIWQFCFQLIMCKRLHIKYKERRDKNGLRLPFMPALSIGFILAFVLQNAVFISLTF